MAGLFAFSQPSLYPHVSRQRWIRGESPAAFSRHMADTRRRFNGGMESISDPVNAEKDIQMKTVATMMATVVIAGSALMAQAAHAQMPLQMQGLSRTDILKSDFSVPGREVLQVKVDFEEGVESPKHAHPGEEIAFVLEGTLEYRSEGRPTVTLNAGDA
eukprot:gene1437-1666_t